MQDKFDDKSYWENYYKEQGKEFNANPSKFAQYLIEKKYLKPELSLIELGCGNGRDSLYFAQMGLKVRAIDQSEFTTHNLNKIKGIVVQTDDFTRLENLEEKADIIYSRFTLHSIDEKGEERVLKWVQSNLKKDGVFCIEARTTKDPIYGKGEQRGKHIWFYQNHHRRFLNAKSFKNKLEEYGFDIHFFQENNDFAPYKNQNPVVLRAIVKVDQR